MKDLPSHRQPSQTKRSKWNKQLFLHDTIKSYQEPSINKKSTKQIQNNQSPIIDTLIKISNGGRQRGSVYFNISYQIDQHKSLTPIQSTISHDQIKTSA